MFGHGGVPVADAVSNRKPSRRWVLRAAVAVVFLLCCWCPTYYVFVAPWWGEVRAKRLQADLNDRLPDGSSREQAEAWFTSHGMREYGVDYGDTVRPPKDGEPGRWVRTGMWGRIPTSALITKAWISISVGFDDNGKVRGRKVVYASDAF